MKVKDFLSELQNTKCYKMFKEKYPDSFFSAGLFILAKADNQKDSFQIDYFIPSEEKMASFEYPFTASKVYDEKITDRKEIKDTNFKIDLDGLSEFVKNEFNKEYSKIIAVLQEGNWNLTCIEGMDMKRVNVDAYTGEVSESGDLKLNDIIKFK